MVSNWIPNYIAWGEKRMFWLGESRMYGSAKPWKIQVQLGLLHVVVPFWDACLLSFPPTHSLAILQSPTQVSSPLGTSLHTHPYPGGWNVQGRRLPPPKEHCYWLNQCYFPGAVPAAISLLYYIMPTQISQDNHPISRSLTPANSLLLY